MLVMTTAVAIATTSDMKLISGIMTEWGDKHEPGATDILRGMFAQSKMPQRSVFFWLLRHFAAVATARSSQSLFERTLRLAASCNISFADVILGLEKEYAFPSPTHTPCIPSPAPWSLPPRSLPCADAALAPTHPDGRLCVGSHAPSACRRRSDQGGRWGHLSGRGDGCGRTQ